MAKKKSTPVKQVIDQPVDLPDDPSYLEQSQKVCPRCGSAPRNEYRNVFECRHCGKVYPK